MLWQGPDTGGSGWAFGQQTRNGIGEFLAAAVRLRAFASQGAGRREGQTDREPEQRCIREGREGLGREAGLEPEEVVARVETGDVTAGPLQTEEEGG